ncbi:MAG: methyltransferase domain-containing protein [Alphaproteobacteria bacterium]|nr:methyltransferase domain-containing protein [Alphaproteobacteria bacterium]
MPAPNIRKRDERLLFLRKLMKNPKSVGAIVPSSPALATFICTHVANSDDQLIVEIGAGTGRFTQALLRTGMKPESLAIVELDKEMYHFLKKNFKGVHVIHGDATQLSQLLPAEWIGQVGTVVSGIPMINLSEEEQNGIVTACFSVMKESGSLLQFTYGPLSPLPAKKMGLRKKRLGSILLNLPPATVWKYWKTTMHMPMHGEKNQRIKDFAFRIRNTQNMKKIIQLHQSIRDKFNND